MSILNYDYDIILCNSQKIELYYLDCYDIQYSNRFDDFNELEFTISYYLNDVDSILYKKQDNRFDLIKSGYVIKLLIKENDNIINTEYFHIDMVKSEDNDGKIYKNIHCYSLEYKLFNEGARLRSYKNQSRVLYDPINNYDPLDNTKGGIINLLLDNIYNTWSVEYISSTLLNIYHIFDISDSTYTDVFKQLEKEYNCFILFNNVNNKISIYDKSEVGENTGLVFSDLNFLKQITNESKIEGLITRLYAYGKDDISIAKYNITGRTYVEDFSYYIDNDLTSSEFKTAWNNYLALIETKRGNFTTYINSLDALNTSLLNRQNELAVLQQELTVIQTQLDALKTSLRKNNATYDSLINDQNDKLDEISAKESQITTIQNSITTTENNITTLQNTLSYENNFTQQLLQEMVNYLHVDTLSLSTVSNEQQLYEYAISWLNLKSQFPLNFDLDSIDLFSCEEGNEDRYKIISGDYINLYAPEIGYNYFEIRIVGYVHNKTRNSLSIKLSNTDDLNTEEWNLNKIFKVTNQVANIVNTEKDNYAKYTVDKPNIINKGDIIDASLNQIDVGNNNFINQRGFVGSNLGTNGAIQILEDSIIISKDNFTTFNTLLSGDGLYLETDNHNSRVVITPDNGFQLDLWNSNTNDFRNAIYIGLESGKPVMKIDNGYMQFSRYIDGVEVNQIKINPDLGIAITKWDSVSSTFKPVFYTNNYGTIIANELSANQATIQGLFKTGGTNSARLEIDDNGIKSYNSSNHLQGLYVSAGTFADLALYNNGNAQFLIYDNATSVDLCAILGTYTPGTSTPSASEVFLTTSGSLTNPQNTWNCSDASFTNLKASSSNYYATQSWVNSQGFLDGNGVSGDFTTSDGKTVYVSNGLITSIE